MSRQCPETFATAQRTCHLLLLFVFLSSCPREGDREKARDVHCTQYSEKEKDIKFPDIYVLVIAAKGSERSI